MKETLLAYAPAVLLWAAVIYKLSPLYRSPRDPGRRALWLTLLFLALALTVLLPPVYVALDRTVGRANLARLISNGLTLVSCWTVQAFLTHLSDAPGSRHDVRRNGVLLGVALAAMAALFLTAPVSEEALDFNQRYGAAPHVLEYRLVFLVYLGIAQATVARLAWRYARIAPHPSLRLGLRIAAAGGVAGLLYVVNDGFYLVTRRFAMPYPLPNPGTVEQILVALAVCLAGIGATIPAWGPRVGVPRFCRWVNRYRSLGRLYSLWLGLYRSCPDIAFLPPPSRDVDTLDFRDVDFRLYRRVVEIRDGILALRPYVDPSFTQLAAQLGREAGLDREERDAVIGAATIVAGQWAKARGQVNTEEGARLSAHGGADLEREVAALELVARSYGRSPIVRAVCARLQAEKTTTWADQWISPNGRDDGTKC